MHADREHLELELLGFAMKLPIVVKFMEDPLPLDRKGNTLDIRGLRGQFLVQSCGEVFDAGLK